MSTTIVPPGEKIAVTCAGCGLAIQTKGGRTPFAWHRRDEARFCVACWKKRYILRAITLPVLRPVDMEWDAFHAILRELWAATTQASNWMMSELYAGDEKRGDQKKLGKPRKTYFYPALRRQFPVLPPQTVTSIEKAITAKYNEKRFDVIWLCSASLPTYKYPTPLPIHNQSWSIGMENDSKDSAPVVTVNLGEGRRVALRLGYGYRFRRQAESVAQMISGEAVCGELAIYRVKKDVLCKMVAWLPRRQFTGVRDGALVVRTDPASLIVALNTKDERLWVYHADQLRRWTAEHRAQLERWADDTKAEQRPVPAFAERRILAAKKHRDRMHGGLHLIASMIVNYAVRRKFAQIAYDDSDHSFAPEFPWFELAQLTGEKADAAQVEFVHTASADEDGEETNGASGVAKKKKRSPLAKKKKPVV